ncbi:MAG: response regulator transcription factor [Lapillicoccus sp.]
MTSVLIADDQEIIRSGLRMVLESQGINVLGEAANGAEAVDGARRLRPDVVLMDIRMPVVNGIAATATIVRERLPSRVLVLTTYDLDGLVYAALRAGAAGFLLKTTAPDRLVAGIELVAAGEALLAPSLTRRLIEEHVRGPEPVAGTPASLSGLTAREVDVLRLVARGLTNDDIAGRLGVSPVTVKTHVNRILAKLGAETRAQAVVQAYETGLVRAGESGSG